MEKPQDKAKRLNAEGRCVLCGKKESPRRLDLWNTDYQRYYRAVAGLSDDQKAVFDADSITAGELLPSSQGRRRPELNPYEARLVKLKAANFESETIQLTDESHDDVTHAEAHYKTKKATQKVAESKQAKNTKKKLG